MNKIQKLFVVSIASDGSLSPEMESRTKINEIIEYLNQPPLQDRGDIKVCGGTMKKCPLAKHSDWCDSCFKSCPDCPKSQEEKCKHDHPHIQKVLYWFCTACNEVISPPVLEWEKDFEKIHKSLPFDDVETRIRFIRDLLNQAIQMKKITDKDIIKRLKMVVKIQKKFIRQLINLSK